MFDSVASRIVLPADCVCGNFQHQNKGDICGFMSNILHAQLFSGTCLSPNIAFVPGRFSDSIACPALSRKWRHMSRLTTRKGYIINPALSLYSLKSLCSQPRLFEKLPQARRREWKAQPLYVRFTVHTLRHKTFSIADGGQNVKAFGENFMRSQSCDRTSYISSGQMFGHKASAPETLVASTVGTRSSSFATINFSCLKK